MTRLLSPRTQWLIAGGLALGLALSFGTAVVLNSFVGKSSGAEVSAPVIPPGVFRVTDAQWVGLKFARVELGSFRTEHTTEGKIANDDDSTTPVFSPYSGRVTKLFAKAGDHVTKGAPLLAVDASEFVQGQNDLVSAESALATARAQFILAQTNEKRQHELYDSKGTALKDWQQAQVDLATAEGNFRSAEIALAAVRNRLRILGKSDAEINAIENAPDRLRMSPEAIVSAPIGGTVVQRQVGSGQYISSEVNGASTPIFMIGDMSTVWLLADVLETDAPSMRLGEPIEVRILAFPGRVFSAKLTYVASAIDAGTHRLPVRAEVENPDGALKPEMFATFSIVTGAPIEAPAVPEEAIVYEGSTAHVWVAGTDKTLSLREIRTGRTREGMVEVLTGLGVGESVVTSGSVFIDRAASSQ
jgi:cobalt-zinc-cadmium efflux system membrane fusion protein